MITVSICEDEAFFASELERLLREYCGLKGIRFSISTFSNGEKLLVSNQAPDIILMDIKLPGSDGMEIVQRLRRLGGGCQVIFITAFQKYVFQAFDLDAVHYILKPATAEKLFPALDKAIKRLSADGGKTFFVSNGTSASRIFLKNILYFDALDHRITVHTLSGTVQFFGSLDAVRENLDDRFFRCHRSYLVNMDHVTEKQSGFAIMDGGDKILIARRKQQEFTRRLLEICRKGLV